jgi:arsenite methyltransferase
MADDAVLSDIRHYYGETLQSSADLQTNACCLDAEPPQWLKDILREIHPEVLARFYGCGSPIPPALSGCTVLDLGCGTGRDCYVLSRLVGPQGRIIGVDMTEQQLAVARQYQAWHAEKFGFANTEFRQGFIEDLSGIPDNSVDVVVSNCVINLSPAKERVFSECLRVLKPGGEIYVSDVFADRRVPEALSRDPILRGECLSGALYLEDFRRLLLQCGVADYRVLSRAPVTVNNPQLQERLGNIRFESITFRAFKLELEDRCEDYGQIAIYKGGIPQQSSAFRLDDHHYFEQGRPLLVCGNTADMLAGSRFGRYFEILGEKRTHFGLFDCAPPSSAPAAPGGGSCC